MSETTYTYTTMVREPSNPTYKFAEIKFGKIVSIQEHWVPLEEYRNFFEADAYFIDITGVKIEEEDPAVGDVVTFDAEGGYRIVHIKSTFNVAQAKAYQIERLKLIRNEKELEPIEYNEHLYDADKDSLMRLDKARMSLEDNSIPSIEWTTADNSRVALTVDDFKGINTQIALRSNNLHVRYNELKTYINSLEDKYLPIIVIVDWDWDMETDLDQKLEELQPSPEPEVPEEGIEETEPEVPVKEEPVEEEPPVTTTEPEEDSQKETDKVEEGGGAEITSPDSDIEESIETKE